MNNLSKKYYEENNTIIKFKYQTRHFNILLYIIMIVP
jgi:hypothetical protein